MSYEPTRAQLDKVKRDMKASEIGKAVLELNLLWDGSNSYAYVPNDGPEKQFKFLCNAVGQVKRVHSFLLGYQDYFHSCEELAYSMLIESIERDCTCDSYDTAVKAGRFPDYFSAEEVKAMCRETSDGAQLDDPEMRMKLQAFRKSRLQIIIAQLEAEGE